MNEVTISTNEYSSLVSKATKAAALISYIDSRDSTYIDTDIIRAIFGISEPIKEVSKTDD